MAAENIETFSIGAVPHFPAEIDTDGSFQSVWSTFYKSAEFNDFFNRLVALNVPLEVYSITQFAPENFIQWFGLLIPDQNVSLPSGWLNLDLPAGEGVWAEEKNLGWKVLPVEFAIQLVYNSANKDNVKLPNRISHSDKPYLIEKINLTKDLVEPQKHRYFIYQGTEEEMFED